MSRSESNGKMMWRAAGICGELRRTVEKYARTRGGSRVFFAVNTRRVQRPAAERAAEEARAVGRMGEVGRARLVHRRALAHCRAR